MALSETAFLEDLQCNSLCAYTIFLFWTNLREWEGFLLRVKFPWLKIKVPHLHGEAFQEVELVILPRKSVGVGLHK